MEQAGFMLSKKETQEIEELQQEEKAINRLLERTVKTAKLMEESFGRHMRAWWIAVGKHYGIDVEHKDYIIVNEAGKFFIVEQDELKPPAVPQKDEP